jgi:succinate-acetate transporter protein
MDKSANPAPLGLLGFGMTTVLLNLHNAGIISNSAMILAMGVMVGGVAQILDGLLEFRRGNTFATTAFTAYGAFWISLVLLLILPDLLPKTATAQAPDAAAMGWYLLLWGIFTAFMTIGTWKANRVLQFVFVSLTVLFGLLVLHKWFDGEGSHTWGRIAGWEGIVCGASAIYLGMAEVINEQLGTTVLPIGARTA